MGVDKMRVDEMGVDEMGTYHKKKLPTGKTIKGNLGFHCTFICPFCQRSSLAEIKTAQASYVAIQENRWQQTFPRQFASVQSILSLLPSYERLASRWLNKLAVPLAYTRSHDLHIAFFQHRQPSPPVQKSPRPYWYVSLLTSISTSISALLMQTNNCGCTAHAQCTSGPAQTFGWQLGLCVVQPG